MPDRVSRCCRILVQDYTTTAEGRAMFGMLAVLAEYQRELILANTTDGLAAARAHGRRRAPAETDR
ncbi:recombinase family protein [Nocardia sp. NBC_01009]|uniref:recombinase family protein n=1 Tax=Nocardia sp. NBC_01009 TaxID=2975996 RepID=UPI0038663176|nr:recombinase family protein [Nocardia sp. NBC_01009]